LNTHGSDADGDDFERIDYDNYWDPKYVPPPKETDGMEEQVRCCFH
jgi:hypothetical protein